MSQQQWNRNVPPGRYLHYKGKYYTVLGVAGFTAAIPPDADFLEYAIRSGDEDKVSPGRIPIYMKDDVLCYFSAEDYGWLVVYRPDYNGQQLTFRDAEEFTEYVSDTTRRFTPVFDD
jgi:hypothetical protein